jgi:hypothetical protein
VWLSACGVTESSRQREQLADARQKWKSSGIVGYSYRFQWSCFCSPEYVAPVIITVRDGVIDSVRYADSSRPLDRSRYADYRTVEKLFDYIQDALDNGAFSVSVVYDAELGYPRNGQIDRAENAMDDESAFRADSLHGL